MSCRPLAAAADFASSAAAASIAWLTSSAQACTDSLNTAPCFATNFLSCGEYMAPQTTSSTLVERLWMCISTGSSDDESLFQLGRSDSEAPLSSIMPSRSCRSPRSSSRQRSTDWPKSSTLAISASFHSCRGALASAHTEPDSSSMSEKSTAFLCPLFARSFQKTIQ